MRTMAGGRGASSTPPDASPRNRAGRAKICLMPTRAGACRDEVPGGAMSGDRAAGGRPIAVHLLPGASQHGHLLRHQRRWVWLEGTAWRQALDRHLPAWRTDARPVPDARAGPSIPRRLDLGLAPPIDRLRAFGGPGALVGGGSAFSGGLQARQLSENHAKRAPPHRSGAGMTWHSWS